MTEETLIRWLRDLDRPAEPAPEFAERLLATLQAERRRRASSRLYLLAAATLLATLAVGMVVVGFGGQRRDAALVAPSPTSELSTPAASVRPAGRLVVEELLTRQEQMALAGTDDALWVAHQELGSATSKLTRIATDGRAVATVDIIGSGADTLAYRPNVGERAYVVIEHQGLRDRAWSLFSVDAATLDAAQAVDLDVEVHDYAVDELDRLWVTHPGGTSILSAEGQVVHSVRAPWARDVNANRANFMAPGVIFGSLWAHEASSRVVHRLDPDTGTILASIPLEACPSKFQSGAYLSGLLYPLTGADGLPDLLVASCAVDWTDLEWGNVMTLIDPATNTVHGTVDMGNLYRRGAVLDGRWWVPTGRAPGIQSTPDRLVAIDPAALAPDQRTEMPMDGGIMEIAATEDSLWAEIFRIDDHGESLVRFRAEQ